MRVARPLQTSDLMPTWGQILQEFRDSAAQRGNLGPDRDAIRLKYIGQLQRLSGRAVIVYASAWLKKPEAGAINLSVEGSDVHALMEACHGLDDNELDLILHSPGGSPQAAEQFVNYLRTQFSYIRALVPLQAKSAATMIALGCDEIVLGQHSELGPVDPQILIPVPGGQRLAPAHAIIRDFDRARREIAEDVKSLPVWTPILHAYAGGLLEFCYQQIALSQDVVAGWLERYMLKHEDSGVAVEDRATRARDIAEYFGSAESYDRFRAHGRPVRLEELQQLDGLRVRALEDDQKLQDAVSSIYHALDITFQATAVKIVENHQGNRYVTVQQQFVLAPASQRPSPRGTDGDRKRKRKR